MGAATTPPSAKGCTRPPTTTPPSACGARRLPPSDCRSGAIAALVRDSKPCDRASSNGLKAAFKATAGVDSHGETKSAKIWSVTVSEHDASFAPYYIFGRLESGELVGLKTSRVWT